MRLEDILPRLSGTKRSGSGWIAQCPAHDDGNPSLSVTEKDGRVLLHCHAGCSYSEVFASLGVSTGPGHVSLTHRNIDSTSFVSKGNSKRVIRQALGAVYNYTDESGKILFQTVRSILTYEDGTSGKKFTARRPPRLDEVPGADGWVHRMDNTRLVLYNLAAIVDADVVFVVEGEKDVDTLAARRLAATCNPFGAGKWRVEFSDTLRGKTVIVIPDNDAPGRKHGAEVANSVHRIASTVFVLEIPDLPEKGDISDFFAGGRTVEELEGLVANAEEWRPVFESTRKSPTAAFEFTRLSELLGEPEEEVSFIWDRTLPSGGFSICSAKPKVGKSTLARNLAVAVDTGEPFLGRDTVKGRVLYLCLEEKRSEVQRHFLKMGVSSNDILIHTGATPDNAVERIDDAIREHNPTLVIIDPLSRVIRVKDFNDYGHMARGLEPLIDLARRSGCHLLALHHDAKMERSGGDSILGSTAIFGAIDCHLQLKKHERGRTITSTQRYGEDIPETVIQLDTETGLVSNVGELKSLRLQFAKDAINASMATGEVLDERSIKDRVEKFTSGLLSKAIRALVEEGALTRTGAGAKSNPYLYTKTTA